MALVYFTTDFKHIEAKIRVFPLVESGICALVTFWKSACFTNELHIFVYVGCLLLLCIPAARV